MLQLEGGPHLLQLEKSPHSNEDPAPTKNKYINKIITAAKKKKKYRFPVVAAPHTSYCASVPGWGKAVFTNPLLEEYGVGCLRATLFEARP